MADGDSQLWTELLCCLSPADAAAVLLYRRLADRWRAAVSRLLQRALVEGVTGRRMGDGLSIRRDAFGKPRLHVEGQGGEEGVRRLWAALSFNVSHHGQWLLLLASWPTPSSTSPLPPSPPPPRVLLGCDVACVELPSRVAARYEAAFPPASFGLSSDSASLLPSLHSALRSSPPSPYQPCAQLLSEYLDAFHSLFTHEEWQSIQHERIPTPLELSDSGVGEEEEAAAGSEGQQRLLRGSPALHCLSVFTVLWSVKESVVKAVGQGLSMDLTAFQATRTTSLDHALYAPHALTWLPSRNPPPHRALGQASGVQPCPVCRSATASTCSCPCACTSCCAALTWQVEVTAIDSRHTAAVAQATAAPCTTAAAQPFAAHSSAQQPHPLAALGQPLPGTRLQSHALRLVSIPQLLQVIREGPVNVHAAQTSSPTPPQDFSLAHR